MPAPSAGPCAPLAEWADVTVCGCVLPSEPTAEQKAAWLGQASAVLWLLTGSRYGLCEDTVRPCLPRCGCLRSPCRCDWAEAIDLGYPIASITSVTVGDDTLDEAAYRVDDWRYLVRLDGLAWPRCGDDANPLEVAYRWGLDVPTILAGAVGRFACELGKACLGGVCELPERVKVQVREGTTFAIIDPAEYLARGGVGIPSIDLVITALGGREASTAGIFDPARAPAVTRTNTSPVPAS